MLEIGQLQADLHTLDKADEASRRQAIQALKKHTAQEWATVPANTVNALVKQLTNQLLFGGKQPSIRQDAATILGNLGPMASAAIPQLIELLQDGVPDNVCEAAATALGKIGKEAKAAVPQFVHLLSTGRQTRVVSIVRALRDIGCADQRVRGALTELWLSPTQSQTCRVQVAIALCKLKFEAKGLMPFLTSTLMASQDASLRKAAAEALGWCNKNEIDAVPALLAAAVDEKNEDVRLTAEASLEQLRLSHDKAIQLCAKQLK